MSISASDVTTSRWMTRRASPPTTSMSWVTAGSAVSSASTIRHVTPVGTVKPEPGPEIAAGSPGSTDSAHSDTAPPGCRTTSMSTRPSPTRSGVNVRSAGRLPSGRRNSLPFHSGMTSSSVPGVGTSSRMLAAGSATSRSTSPSKITRNIRGETSSRRTTETGTRGGGSRRSRFRSSSRSASDCSSLVIEVRPAMVGRR